MKKKSFLNFITLSLCLILCLSALPVSALESERVNKVYSADVAYGKIFENGENEPIFTKNQFDTQIRNISISNKDSEYYLQFVFESKNFEIKGKLVSAKANNVNNDHYLFAPDEFASEVFSFVTIYLTTSANEFDVMPANSDLIGTSVLSIIFEHKQTKDIYYWQTKLTSEVRGEHSFKTCSEEISIDKANEFYYMKGSERVDSCSSSDFITEDMATVEEYEAMKARDYSQMTRSDHNPYYDLGIPDSTFKTATESWQWLPVGRDVYGNYLPIRYYAYSYTKYGNPNIMTHIMIVGHTWQGDANYTLYYDENNELYAKASGMLKVELFEVPHTVVYYTGSDSFDFMLGGEYLTHIVEPAVEIKKTSSGIPHVVVGRYEFSDATKKGNFLGLGALVLKEVAVGVLDLPSFGFASVLVDIGELISDASTSVGANDGYIPIEEYYSNYMTQVQRYGEAMGSIKSRVRGYLQDEGQHLGVRVWFATPNANRANVNNIGWVYYVSPDYT